MSLPRAASPSSVIGISGAGGELACCANAAAPKAQLRTVTTAANERNTGGGSQEIPFSKARILAKTRAAWQGRRPQMPAARGTQLYGCRRRIEMASDAALAAAVRNRP